MIQRYKLTIAYRGTRYHGWQFQLPNSLYKGPTPPPGHGIPTIQETVSRALTYVLRQPVSVVGSSRTDAGVHAKGQVAHFDSNLPQIPVDGLRRAINHALPDDILVRTLETVDQSFNAVTSPMRKRYQYFIWNALDRFVFAPDLCWHRWQELDIEAMREAAKYFVGDHDFASFARPRHGRYETVRTIYACDVSKRGPRLVIGIEGNGFLWNMVRIMTGTLVEVALKKYSPSDISEMLQAKKRTAAGSTAPPHGLFLQWIKTR